MTDNRGMSLGALQGGLPFKVSPPQDEQDLANRTSALTDLLRSPQAVAALIQFGGRLMQPRPPGQTTGGQVGQGLTEGLAAAGRVQTAEQDQQNTEANRALQERRVVSEETRTDIAQQAETRAEGQGQQRIDIAQQTQEEQARANQARETARSTEFDITTELQTERNEIARLRAEAATATTDIARTRVQNELTIAQNKIDARVQELAAQLATRERIATTTSTLNVVAGLIKNEASAAFDTNRPARTSKQVAEEARSIIDSFLRLPPDQQPGGANSPLPADPAQIPEEALITIFQNPKQEAALFAAYPNQAEAITALKTQLQAAGKLVPAPAPETPQAPLPAVQPPQPEF